MTLPLFPDLTRDEVFMIGTDRLWLRWPRLDDAETLARIGGHPAVAANTATWPVGCDAADARERIVLYRARLAKGEALSLVIARRQSWSQAIGLVGISTGVDGGTLGFHLDPGHWGRGYASEAVAGLINMTRLLTRLPRLTAGVMPHNRASMRVLEKNGFTQGGLTTFDSPLKGPVQVVQFERRLRYHADESVLKPPVRPASLPRAHLPLRACA